MQGFDGKSSTLTHFAAFEEHMADKCLAKPSWRFFLLIGFYMRRINYDSATVNNPVFIEQRNISFQNNISLKTMSLGDLSWENCETHGRIVSLDQFGSRRAIADLFVMFIAWARKKASNVHKPPSKLAIVLISNIQSPLIVQWKVQNHNMKSSGHNARSELLDRGTGTIDLRQLSFWYRALSCRAD